VSHGGVAQQLGPEALIASVGLCVLPASNYGLKVELSN
jgi:hypothetical protein